MHGLAIQRMAGDVVVDQRGSYPFQGGRCRVVLVSERAGHGGGNVDGRAGKNVVMAGTNAGRKTELNGWRGFIAGGWRRNEERHGLADDRAIVGITGEGSDHRIVAGLARGAGQGVSRVVVIRQTQRRR